MLHCLSLFNYSKANPPKHWRLGSCCCSKAIFKDSTSGLLPGTLDLTSRSAANKQLFKRRTFLQLLSFSRLFLVSLFVMFCFTKNITACQSSPPHIWHVPGTNHSERQRRNGKAVDLFQNHQLSKSAQSDTFYKKSMLYFFFFFCSTILIFVKFQKL